MAVTIDLPPDIEAGLAAQAAARGVSLQQYLRDMLEGQVPPRAPLAPRERAAFWRKSAGGLPHTPPLSDDVINRASLYEPRG